MSKIIKYITLILLAVYFAVVTVFMIFGADIRDALSPNVDIVYPELVSFETVLVPESAVMYDDEGAAYVFVAVKDKNYPELAYKAERKNAVLFEIKDGMAEISAIIAPSDKVILNPDDVPEGKRVVIRK